MSKPLNKRLLWGGVAVLAMAVGAFWVAHREPAPAGAQAPAAVSASMSTSVRLATKSATVNTVTNGLVGGVTAAKVVQPSQPAGGEIIAYRRAPLAAKRKGGFSGELREWLIRPKEGYVSHLEEEWYPNAAGEMTLGTWREYVANQVLVTVDGETSVEKLREEMAKVGATVKEPLMELPKGGKILAVMSPKAEFETAADLQDRLLAANGKIKVELDPIQRIERIPDDPRYRGLWGMKAINAPAAWDLATEATNVTVAVLDTGVNYLHEDLTDNILRDRENLPFPYVVGFRSIGGVQTNDPMDDNGHGTHCAGTVAGRGNNGKGVAGVTWKTRIMPLKFLNAEGKGATSDSIYCLRWARTHGAQVISCSFGCYSYSGAQETAMRQLGIMGAAFACAAGNESKDTDKIPHYPSSYDLDNIIAVASTGPTNTLSEFSCYGAQSVDLGAPGEDIVSTCISYTATDTCYESLSGTSMATPHVAGAMTLLRGFYPGDVYWQTMQRILLNGADTEALREVTATGKRLDLCGAVASPIPPAPVVSATAGTLEDRVEVSWKPVGGASHYKLWRRWSEGGDLTELTGWTTNLVYVDREAEVKTGYHYYVRSSKHETGENCSPLSPAAVGYKMRPMEDEWDHDDDVAALATAIVPTDQVQEHGEHTLSKKDGEDWFKITMKGSLAYVFESKGSADLFAELYNAAGTNLEDRVEYDDDGGEGLNFKLVYTPPADGEYWLKVTRRNEENAFYRLAYSIADWSDEWDPADDTFTGATAIEIGAEETVHGLHALSALDRQDVFTFALTAGRTYVFKSTGDSDTYGELYFESSAAGNVVAFNDDGHDAASGSELNFRIVYTPQASGTYYLKVRTCRERTSAAYNLVCREEAEAFDFGFTSDELCQSQKGWNKNLITVAAADGVAGRTDFAAGETLYLKWAFNETDWIAVERPVTNLVELLNVQGERIVWGDAVWDGAIQAGAFIDFTTEIPGLPAGAYVLKVTLNSDVNGNPSHAEPDRADNVATVGFTVRDADTAVTALAIEGNASVPMKGTAAYRAVATFADGTTGDVSPEWSVTAGAEYATLAADGTLTAAAVTQNRAVTIRAVYGGQVVGKAVTILAQASAPASPFGSPTYYPSYPMTVSATVLINGVAAGPGDYLAAFAGSELRGTAKIGEGGQVRIPVYVAQSDERISFKVFDASEGDEGSILTCAETVAGVAGAEVGPLTLTATLDDPFGTPEEPLAPEKPGEKTGTATIYATVRINGMTAAPGDMLAVFDGTRLAGKARISLLSSVFGLFKGAAGCTVEVKITGETELTFLVWDRSRLKLCSTTTVLTLKPGDKAGTALKPIEIEVNDKTRVSFWYPLAGWHLASLGINPTDAQLEQTFATEGNVIDEVKDGAGESWKPGETSGTTVGVENGYWVHTAEDDVNLSVEGEPDPKCVIALSRGWNLVGYPLERAGRVADVLRTALKSGKVTEIADETGVYPGGNLTMMYPGRGYWMKAAADCEIVFDETGMISAGGAGLQFGPFGDGTDVVRSPVMPVRYTDVSLTLCGAPVAFGDCVAFFGKTDGRLYAVAKVDSENGTVSLPVYAVAGTVLTARLWNADSGTETPQFFSAVEPADITVPEAGMEVSGLAIDFTPAKPGSGEDVVTYAVKFDLGDKAVRTGGGELEQKVTAGQAAVAPTLEVTDGWTFAYWDCPFASVRSDLTVRAMFEKTVVAPPAPDTRPHYTVIYDANGGEGEMPEQTCIVGEEMLVPDCGYTREGRKLVGWSTRPDGTGVRIAVVGTGSPETVRPSFRDLVEEDGGTVRLYAQWAVESGFDVGVRTYVCNEGRTITVPVRFDSAQALNCISVKLAYDSQILSLRKVSEGTLAELFTDDFTVTEPKVGTVCASLFAKGDTVPGAGTVAELTFTVREGAAGNFSDITVSDVQLGESTGVRDLTAEHAVTVTHGMVRVMRADAAVARLEQAETICADTVLATLDLADGDAIQASDFQTPIMVAGAVRAEAGVIPVECPPNGWAGGIYALIRTTTEGLNLRLTDCAAVWQVSSERIDGVVTYYATVDAEDTMEVTAGGGEKLAAGTQNQIRKLVSELVPARVSKLTVFGPAGMIPLIADMGIAPEVVVRGTEAEARYRTPTIRIIRFEPETRLLRIKVEPGEGNAIVSELATGYVHVYGTSDLSKGMERIAKVGFDLAPYLKTETKGEADLAIDFGSHSFFKVKVEEPVEIDASVPYNR